MIINCDTTRFIWEVLENGEYSFMFDHLRVLDLGCNIGTFSLWIYPRADVIYAVDAEQRNIDLFNETIKENRMDKIKTYVERVSDLGQFMSGNVIKDIDVLKIDIEGDEYDVLSRDFPHIPTIIGEYHKDLPETQLLRLGYRVIDLPNKHFIARK